MYYYIPIADDTKRPVLSWGGWPIDPDHENVFLKRETVESDHDTWAIAGCESHNLLVIDVDYYKMSDDTKEQVDSGWMNLLDSTRVVSTQSGGIHVYFLYDGTELPRPIDAVDVKGDVGKGYVLSPMSDGYTLEQDLQPLPIETEVVEDLPVFRNEDPRPIDGSTGDVRAFGSMTAKRMTPPCHNAAEKAMGSHEDPEDIAARFILDYHRQNGDDERVIEDIFEASFGSDGIPTNLDSSTILVTDILNGFPVERRVEHPDFLHDSPSDTKSNFMIDRGGETFRCWRHDATGNALHLLGVKAGVINCGDWKSGLDRDTWSQIFSYAEDRGYDVSEALIDCDDLKEAGFCPYDCRRPIPYV